ncbi:MAG: MATE family efflux transporter [Oscillospiraceae bacterium]|nr:MATE family efflux transporter [Oscillospiraceae bacterium]
MVSTKTNQTDALGTESIGKLFFRLSLPAVAAQMINLLYSLIDRIYIGHIEGIGTQALTGVGVCLPLILIISAFAAFAGMGGAPRASIFLGKGDRPSAEKTLGNCFSLMLLLSVALTAVFQLFSKELLLAFGASKNTIAYAEDYMLTYSLGTVFVLLTMGLNSFISAQGFAKISMYTILIGAVSNIILDPILIFALSLGVRGAAIATVISQGFSAVWTLLFLTGRKTTIRLKPGSMKPDFRILLPCLGLGLSPFIMNATESGIMVCFNSSLQHYGGDLAVGAMTIMTCVLQFSFLPLLGFTQGAQPIISYNYGAKNAERVKKAFKILLAACMIYSSVLWAAVELWPQGFIKIFNSDKTLVEFTVPALRLYLSVCCIFGIQIACQQTFIALGKAKSALSVAILRKLVLIIPLIYILPQLNLPVSETTAVYMAEPLSDAVSVAYTAILFSFVFKRTLKEIENGADEHRQSGLFRFLRRAILFFTGPMKTIWEEPFAGGPAVFVANHDMALGPIAMNVQFELCEDTRSWINAQTLSVKALPAYIRQDFWWPSGKWYTKILDYTVAYACSLILPLILKGSDCIPVYHDTGVMSTLRQSIKTLSDGKHLLLFPEHPSGYHEYGEKIFDGFVSVGKLYYARKKESVLFYPTFVDWKKRTIRVGKPVSYDPNMNFAEQSAGITGAIETFFSRGGM